MAVQWDKLESIAYPLLLTHRTRTLERFRMSVNVARGMDMGYPPPRRPVGALRCPVLLRAGGGGGGGLAHCFVGARRLVDLDLPAASTGDCYYYRLQRLHLTGVSLGGHFVEQVRLRLPVWRTCGSAIRHELRRYRVADVDEAGHPRQCRPRQRKQWGASVTAPRLSSLCLLSHWAPPCLRRRPRSHRAFLLQLPPATARGHRGSALLLSRDRED
mgnify:CR=1 FL=1|jgi:hypothetical protein